jgi:hypothetical protein
MSSAVERLSSFIGVVLSCNAKHKYSGEMAIDSSASSIHHFYLEQQSVGESERRRCNGLLMRYHELYVSVHRAKSAEGSGRVVLTGVYAALQSPSFSCWGKFLRRCVMEYDPRELSGPRLYHIILGQAMLPSKSQQTIKPYQIKQNV